jgi:hypothetical protein
MTPHVQRIDEYIKLNGYIPLADDGVWQQIVERVLFLYGPQLYYRCIGITEQAEPMGRFYTVFPDNLTVPPRHIKYLELLITDSPLCKQLVDWLHSLGVPTQRVWGTDDEDDVGALRIFGYADPNVSQSCPTPH